MEIDKSLSSWLLGDLDCDYDSVECIDMVGRFHVLDCLLGS